MSDSQAKQSFLERKDIKISFRRYAIDAFGAMAQGLFASLLIGTILSTLGDITGIEVLATIGGYAKSVAGPAMAVAIGSALAAPPLVLYSLAAVGFAANDAGGAGGPLAVFLIAIVACELGKAVSKETKVDILVTPAVTVGAGCALALAVGPAIGAAASALGSLVMWATDLQPFLMGIVVAVVVGAALTLPISSAAVVSQGLGTSMLQVPNIVKKPVTWVPALVASAVTGPVATQVFHLEQMGPAIASGMGTCGLVGPIGLYTGWIETGVTPGAMQWLAMAVVCLILPAALSWSVAALMRRAHVIEPGDMRID